MNALAAHSQSAATDAITRWSLAPHRPAPKDSRRLLVAIASSGAGCVDSSFEDAGEFLLYEKSGERTCFVGRQPCPLGFQRGDRSKRARLFADCDLVVCSGISEDCRQTLSAFGVSCELTFAGARIGDAVSAL